MKNSFLTASRFLLTYSAFCALSVHAAFNVSVTPAQIVQQTNTHLAFTATVTGGSGTISYAWSGPNGVLNNVRQNDGSTISGASSPVLVISNLQTADSGTYTVTVNDTGGDSAAQASASLNVVANLLPFVGTTNLVVARVGDGGEPLSWATGNTVYLDQFQTNGTYVNTIMIPDAGSNSLLVCGAGPDAPYEATLTLAANNQYLALGGYNYSYPYSGAGLVNSNSTHYRMWSSVNGLGYYMENAGPGQTLNPSGDYTGDNYFMRGVYTDGSNSWWSTGTTANNEVRTISSANKAGSISEGGVSKDNDIFIQYIASANCIAYSDNPGGSNALGVSYNGIMAIAGFPNSGSAIQVLSVGPSGNPTDFAVSPDSQTVYIADLRPFVSGDFGTNGGGIQRWDASGTQLLGGVTIPTWTNSYSLPLSAAGGTNGAIAVTVDFGAASTWGPGTQGAVIYATTAGGYSNSLVRMVDNGPSSVPTAVLEVATTNELLRGIRFAPAQVPPSVTSFTVALGTGTAVAAPAVTYTSSTTNVIIKAATITGDQPFTYGWTHNGTPVTNGLQASGSTVSGAATATLTITSAQAGDSGSYSLTLANGLGSTSFPATVLDFLTATISPLSATVTPGANTNFVAAANGFGPITFLWYEQGSPMTGSTTFGGSTAAGITSSNLQLSNISLNDGGATFYCVISNAYGSVTTAQATLLVANPTFLTNPSNQTVYATGTAVFTATALGQPSPTFSWLLNGTPLANGLQANGSFVSGATTTNLTITNVLCALNFANIQAVASNSQNQVQSSSASLVVIDPYIVAPPSSVGLTSAGTAVFSVGAVGTQPLTYQWYGPNGQISDGNSTFNDGAKFSGSTTSNLTIQSATANEAGSYYVIVNNSTCGQSTNSPAASLYFELPLENQSVWPPLQVIKAGSHVGFYAGGDDQNTGGINYQWYFTNTSGAGSALLGQTGAGLLVSNISSGNAGTYAVTIGNAFGTNFAPGFGVLVVSNTYIPLSSSNLIIARVGDNVQTLSGTTGNTLYLDQYTTNGVYLNSLLVPDSGATPVVELGAGNDAIYETYLALSSNNNYLNFAGYGYAYPFTAFGAVNNNTANKRSMVTVNALGSATVPDTANGDYTTGTEYFRAVFSPDGLINFFLLGTTANNGGRIVIINGSAGAFSVAGVTVDNDRCFGYVGSNLYFSDSVSSTNSGIEILPGTPLGGGTATNFLPTPSGNSVNDFAISPDVKTVYVSDDDAFLGTNSQSGGIERYDTNTVSGGWTWSYTLPLANSQTATPGSTALTAVFPASTSAWGAGVNGAILYAVTTGASGNNLVRIVDNGPGSTPITLATCGTNELFRGIRFGPTAIPFGASIVPTTQTTSPGGNLTFSATATGYQPLTYQWSLNGTNLSNGVNSAIDPNATFSGATSLTLSVGNISAAETGAYTLVVSNVAAYTTATATNVVTGSVPAAPQFGVVESLGGGNVQLTFSGNNGSAYRLWASTNLALAPIITKWTLVTNGTFGASAVTVNASATNGANFYVITEP
jgi:hypothetical protein